MAISFSRPDPSSPASVRDANFPTARRGFDQQEVRDFLRMVAAELARMQERERYLDQELRSMRHRRPPAPAELDEETVARLLGEETTRIVQAARESATAMRKRAEDVAERLLKDARDEAQRLRDDAEAETSRRRKDAESDAVAELEMAKQQGREMVEEARAYRERVLSELSRRRDLARQQIDQLVHGRDRLVQAFERARLVAADVVAELAPLGELNEYVNLSPTTGPVPVMIPASRLAEMSSISDDALAARAAADPDDPALDPNGHDGGGVVRSDSTRAIDVRLASRTGDVASEAVEEASTGPVDVTSSPGAGQPAENERAAPVAPSPTAGQGATVLQFPDRRADQVVVAPGSEAEVEVDDGAGDESESTVPEPTSVDADLDPGSDADSDADVDGVAGTIDGAAPASVEAADEVDDDDITANDVDDLFARLRADGVGEPTAPADATEPDTEASTGASTEATTTGEQDQPPSPFDLRDEALTPLIVRAARRLKRVLADEQNDVLDRLRGKAPVSSVDDVLPERQAHAAAYLEAVAAELLAAARSGGESMRDLDPAFDAGVVDALASTRDLLASDLVASLRDRLAARLGDGGDREELATGARAIYREWKTKHIDEHLDDLLRHAYARGAFAALGDGEQMRWMFDPSVGACSECEDNTLQGAVAAGTAYPTGHVGPPAHAGCRCLLVRAT